MGTTGYRWGDVRRPAPNTTPEGPLFWVTLKDMANGGADSCVMEVSSHALALGRTEGLRCAYALFTNLSRDHLDFHPDMEGYFQAKRLLFTERLKGGGPGPRAAVNADDPYGARLKGELGEGALSFGFQSGEIRGKVLSESREGVSVSVMGPQWETEVRSKLLGGFNAENLLASLALLSLTGAGVQEAARLLGGAPGAPGRLERAGPPESRYLALVDYAHSPGALTAVVAAAKRLTGSGGRLIVVFGCGGDRDRGKRPLMGAAAAGADLPILTSDNPRTEDPEAIMLDAEPGLAGAGLKRAGPKSLGESEEGLKGVYFKEADRRRAIELGCRLLRPQDALLIAGKGHEDYQIIGRAKHPFDDRAEAEKALAALGKGA
jgi:UDP-N-acetylmuramoyl-L-alanyl-D-glutamate--2,6-diaminopimelate ligase